MEAITIRKATEKEIKALSRKIGKLLEDKTGKLYQDSVVKFGVPEEYGKKVFSEKVLVEAARSEKATFYLALRNRREIMGFAQIVGHDPTTVELDRIVVFPGYERLGIGTKLLKRAIADQKKQRVRTLIVKASRDEAHARAFYEKNGFKQVKEETLKSPWGKEIPLVEYCFQLISA
jgi:N-acetylglutamate synthase-like GNAT family acetyltransferase